MPGNLENSAVATGLKKGQFSFQSQRRAVPKNVQTITQLYSFHMLARLWLKSFRLDFNSMWTKNFQLYMLEVGFWRGRGTRDQIAQNLLDHEESKGVPEKHLLLLHLWLCSVQFSHSVVSDSLQPYESQHARPPCPSPTPGVHSDSCSSSQWCHPAISSSVVPFFSCPQSLPAPKSFPMSQHVIGIKY